jgi:hypothetical protein
VCRAADVFPRGDPSDRLPDLIVRWSEEPAATHRAVVSDRFGRIERATPGRIPNGRSGNHRARGWLIARGAGIGAGARLAPGADILDLAPTAVAQLGAACEAPLAGRPLPQLLAR